MNTRFDKTDIVILERIREGERDAFDELFRKYYSRLCHFAYKILKSKEDAREVVQKTFINIWQNRNTLIVNTSLLAYLFGAVKNNAFNFVKKNKIQRSYESDYAINFVARAEETKMEGDSKLKDLIREAINQLPGKCKDIYEMSKMEGLSYEEIADYMQISKKTVENQMGIAFQKLRQFLTPHMNQYL